MNTKIKRVHFVGIGGSGVAGVAKLAEKMGYEVTGCDLEASTAYAKNIFQGHDVDHIKNVDLVVASPAVFYQNSKHPEFIEAQKRKILMSWQEFLGKYLLQNKKLICIAGTHGKSTTTAMAGKMLIDNGFDPIVVLGANVPEWGGSSRFGQGEYAIVEADEFNNNFLNYHPEIAVINNIEFDHPDFFKNEKEVKESFEKFKNNLVGRKLLITEKDSLNKRFNLKIFGEHNQKNANMVFLLGKALGIDEEKIIQSIESFRGIGRRMELIGERNGIKVYDDYAHHPTAIATTLRGVREKYPKAKILVINEPHGYKRTKALLENYKGVFDAADKVIIGPIFQARDEKDDSVTPELVAKTSNHKDAVGFDSFDKIIENCKLIIGNYDVVVVMGAGKSYLWAREILSIIPVKFVTNYSLKNNNTFKIDIKAKYFAEVKSIGEINEVLSLSEVKDLPILVLGDGANILFTKNFDGLVIKIKIEGINVVDETKDSVILEIGAGEEWDDLVTFAVNNNWGGIENMALIPGTVGAAAAQNIAAYGQNLIDVFVSLDAFDLVNGNIKTFTKDECEFSYRESIFKNKLKNKFIVTKIRIKLTKNPIVNIDYFETGKTYTSKGSLRNEIETTNKPPYSIKDVSKAVINIRKRKLPDPNIIGTAGSFFKNPIVTKEIYENLKKEDSDLQCYPVDKLTYPKLDDTALTYADYVKLPAGRLLDNLGWKGKKIGKVGTFPSQALAVVNYGASGKEILEFTKKMQEDVYNKYKIKLEPEVNII